MNRVYADNSATSFPKAPGVAAAIKDFFDYSGCNINRGGYGKAYAAALDVLATRQLMGNLFNFDQPRNVIFTPGITYSLNMILQGFLQTGDHIITTSMEHNGLMRPLHQLTHKGVKYDIAKCAPDGTLNPQDIIRLINRTTKAVVMTHASNVCGTILPLAEVAEICRQYNLKLIVDSAQTAGVIDIDMAGIDALAFTCHKGLLAAPGLGGFIIKSDLAEQIKPLITGGTGSLSHEITQPDLLPDKFESGTMNIPAIIGLKKALEYLNSVGLKTIYEQELLLAERFMAGVGQMAGVAIIGKQGLVGRIAVVSLDFAQLDNAEVAARLDSDYGIMTRCGLHCAPNAHQTLGTYPRGTVRFSFGHFNSADDIDYIISAIKEILSKPKEMDENYGF